MNPISLQAALESCDDDQWLLLCDALTTGEAPAPIREKALKHREFRHFFNRYAVIHGVPSKQVTRTH